MESQKLRDTQMESQKLRDQFAERLKEAMADTEIPKNQWAKTIARWLGKNEKNPMFAWKWMNAETKPRDQNLEPLAKALGVRAEWLIYGSGQKHALDEKTQNYVDQAEELLKTMSEDEMQRAIKILEAYSNSS